MKNEKREMGKLIIVRGGGDLATGTIHKLWSAGFFVVVLETQYPAAIRRQVSLCEAVYGGETSVEDMSGVLAFDEDEVFSVLEEGKVPVVVDPEGKFIAKWKPEVVVDGILAKRNLGTAGSCGRRHSGEKKFGNPQGNGAAYDCVGTGILCRKRCGCGDRNKKRP